MKCTFFEGQFKFKGRATQLWAEIYLVQVLNLEFLFSKIKKATTSNGLS